MNIKTAMRHLVLALFILVGIYGLPFPAGAGKAENWVIRSEYRSPVPGREKSTVWWRFESHSSALGEVEVVVVSDVNSRVKARAEFYYDQGKNLLQADCYRHVRGAEICDARIYDLSAPAIMNQTLIPGDWLNCELPFVVHEDSREYWVDHKIGITGFASHLLVKEQDVSLQEALDSGMIEDDNKLFFDYKHLRLLVVFRVVGLRDEILMRQLWAVGDDFWLYEEKGLRRSWRFSETQLE